MTSPDFPNLKAMHRCRKVRSSAASAIRFKANGLWHDISWNDYRRQADDVAAGLIGLGVKPGDRIAILAENRPEWLVADHAILSAPLQSTCRFTPLSTPQQIQFQLEHSASGVIVSTPAQWEKIAAVKSQLPNLRFAIGMDQRPESPGLAVSWNALLHAGKPPAAADGKRSPREAAVTPDSLATIIYTSGTTNRPKGVMLSQSNLVTNLLAGARSSTASITRSRGSTGCRSATSSPGWSTIIRRRGSASRWRWPNRRPRSWTTFGEIQPTYFTSVPPAGKA